ncbi:MAG: hypothetical protein Q4B13_04790 [Lautropia sp.]|nr:hypothetical protein [Lautropia sp.]
MADVLCDKSSVLDICSIGGAAFFRQSLLHSKQAFDVRAGHESGQGMCRDIVAVAGRDGMGGG